MKSCGRQQALFSPSDKKFMKRALSLAKRGMGRVSPNPLVGAVIVKDGEIIGEGFHRGYGEKHAEAEAVDSARRDVSGADLYCSLEPCCHSGPGKHQPPCTDLIIKNKIGRVILATLDPNPRVDGKGVRALREAGIDVRLGLFEKEAEEMNPGFFTFQKTGRPFIHLKLAQSLDGRIAARNGDAKWITDDRARQQVHRLRASHDAVLVGIGTVLADDPSLTVRLCRGRDPLRVVLDGGLAIPPEALLVSDGKPGNTIIFYTNPLADEKANRLREGGVRVVRASRGLDGETEVREVLDLLAGIGVRSILVEGGSGIATSFLRENLVDKITVFIAPLLIGTGIEAVGDLGVEFLAEAGRLHEVCIKTLGDQVVFQGMRSR